MSGVVERPIDKTIKDEHRRVLLDQGRANFDEALNGVSGKDRSLLYCYYYMQMHLSSSFVLIGNIKVIIAKNIQAKKEVIFVDFGCGPLTSAIALRKHFPEEDLKLHYIGIDTSKEMIAKAKIFQNYEDLFSDSQKFYWLDDYNNLLELLKTIKSPTDDVSLIFNFSYFFASHTVIAEEVANVTKESLKLFENVPLLILHQNPNNSDLNVKWNEFCTFVLNEEIKKVAGFPGVINFTFKDILGSSHYSNPSLSTYCDILIKEIK